jgi:hypothetical protein
LPKTRTKKKNRERDDGKKLPSRVRGLLFFLLGTVFGTVVGLYLAQTFVDILPGPKVRLEIQGMRPKVGNPVGCILYSLVIISDYDKPIEYVYAKIQFPNTITDYKVGTPSEAVMTDGGRTKAQMFAAGKNEKGGCVIKADLKAAVNMQASAAGNMITILASKLSPKSSVFGLVATQEGQTFVQPAPKIFTEGAYEYIKLGHVVRKPMLVIDRGMTDLK